LANCAAFADASSGDAVRVVVTGASGFVGRHACATLAEQGHEIVRVSSLRGGGDHRVDLSDGSAVESLLAHSQPDAVVHLAGRMHPSGHEHLRELLEQNAIPAWTLLETVRRCRLAARIVVVSSSAVYGYVASDRNPVVEDQSLRPSLPYGVAKLAVEAIASSYARAGLDLVVLRPFNLAGPGQSQDFVPASFAAQLALVEAGRAFGIRVGRLDRWRDFTDVRDLARAIALLLPGAAGFGPYNVCTGEARSIRDVLKDLLDVAGASETQIEEKPEGPGLLDIPYQCGSAVAIRAAVNWSPQIDWRHTLRDTVTDWRGRVGGAENDVEK
jgi:GDP-4-dehydro-6-deoxy-D-mannose reductase